MLGKLLKHDMKALAHWFVPIYIGIGLASVLFGFVWTINLTWESEIFSTIMTPFLIFLFMVILATIFLGTFIVIIVQFYKTMVSDEGYLTHTLPVTVDQLLVSKGIAAFIWEIISVIATAAVIIFFIFLTLVTTGAIHTEGWSSLVDAWNTFKTEFANALEIGAGSWMLLFIEGILLMIISTLSKIFLVYLSIALGQCVKGHKFLWSTVFYICILIGTNLISQIVSTVVMLGFGISTSEVIFSSGNYFNLYTHGVMIMSIVLSAVYFIASYLLSRYLLKNRLNLE